MRVWKRKDSPYYSFRFTWKGKAIERSTKTTNKRDALAIAAAARTALAKGEYDLNEKAPIPTLSEFAPKFTGAVETGCAEKPATIRFYKAKLAILVKHLGSRRLDELDEAAIQQFIEKRSRTTSRRNTILSPASINRELATLRKLLRLAHEWKVLNRVPRIRLLRGERQREFVLSYDMERVYFSAASAYPDLLDVTEFLLETGLRIREALTLEWPDVHMIPAAGAKFGYLKVRAKHAKSSKARFVPLTHRAVEVLRRRKPNSEGLVFHRGDGSALYQTWLNQQHAAIRKLLKLPTDFVLHSFRHSYATRLGEAGADAFGIMRLLGHCSIVVSQKYVHPSSQAIESAVSRLEALNMQQRFGVGAQVGAATSSNSVESQQVV